MSDKIQSLLKEAIKCENTGQIEETEKLAKQVLDLTDNDEDQQSNLNIQISRAKAYNLLSRSYSKQGNGNLTFEMAEKALTFSRQTNDRKEEADALTSIGISKGILSDFPAAMQFLQQALSIYEELEDADGLAHVDRSMGNVYTHIADYRNALEHYQRSLAYYKSTGDKRNESSIVGNIGVLYSFLSDDKRALKYFHESMSINESLNNKRRSAGDLANIGLIHENHKDYELALEYLERSYLYAKELDHKSTIAINAGNLGRVYGKLNKHKEALDFLHQAIKLSKEVDDSRMLAHWLIAIGELLIEPKTSDHKEAESFLVQALELSQKVGLKRIEAESHKFLAELKRGQELWKDADHHFRSFYNIDSEIKNEEAKKNSLMLDFQRKIEDAERDRQVKLAKHQEQEKILHNILPSSIADRMVEGEKNIADSYKNVSVFFSDIVGFTELSSSLSSSELVTLLNDIFRTFDNLALKHGLEKIKTIGDAYMAVAGAPTSQEDHAERAARFALEVQTFMKAHKAINGIQIQIRIGLHCGEAVAGIIGESKFAYDLWGDTVNVASRMETEGEAGEIHCSEDFKSAIPSPEIEFQFRSEVQIKGKGMMKTYFVKGNAKP